MKTSEKPKIFFTVATVHVPQYGELIASEKRALPRLQKELNEANQLKMESHRTMMSRHRKRKQEVHMEYQFTCPECSNFIINHDTEETPPKTISCPYCKKTIINENYTPQKVYPLT